MGDGSGKRMLYMWLFCMLSTIIGNLLAMWIYFGRVSIAY
jgi:hypothetical protein